MKKILSVVMALVMVLSLSIVSASANNITTGECGKSAYYKLDGYKLTIYGTGSVEINSRNDELRNKFRNITTLIVDKGITSIPEKAFNYCSNLAYVELSDTVNLIGRFAFTNDKNLRTVKFTNGSNLERIDESAFENTNISNINISKVTRIKDRVFKDCKNLNHVFINEAFDIGESAFQNCNKLQTIELPNVVYIQDFAFANSGVSNVTLSPNLKVLCNYSFKGCYSMKNITIPNKVTIISDNCFYDCKFLTMSGYNTYTESYAKNNNIKYINLGTKVSVPNTNVKLYTKGTYNINSLISNGVGNTIYKSSNNSIITVSATGKVSVLKKGTATVIVTNNGVSSTIKFTVSNPTLNRNTVTLQVKKTYTLKITGKIGTAKFKSSNNNIATVNSNGVITAKKKGITYIVVTTNGINLRCKVIIK